jgi:hypothetical protein
LGRADLEGAEVCIFFGIFITKLLSNLLLMSCTKLLEDGIGHYTFGGEDGSESSNQKCQIAISWQESESPLGFVILNSKSNRFKPSYWKVHPCSP